jgi:prepilin-type N-terminal cleavage/methylation domain-containing protein
MNSFFPVYPGLKALADFRLKPVLRQGFSLIEILVATTILLIIVMLMSMVFQQSSGAYQSGTTRVNAQKVLRIVLGVISRDMALAVDSRNYPGLDQQFAADNVAFVALTGRPDATRRSPQWIEFTYADGKVTRRCSGLKWTGSAWAKDGTQTSVLNPDHDLVDFSFGITDHPQDPAGVGLPLRVEVYGEIETSGTFAFARGRSAGRDRLFGTADDIIAGGQ